MYFKQQYVQEDYKKAITHFTIAAEKKYSKALNNLSFCYCFGIGVDKALELAELALELGDNEAKITIKLIKTTSKKNFNKINI